MDAFKGEIGNDMKSLLGTFTGGPTGRKVDLEVLNNESHRMQTAIVHMLPILVRWLVTYRAPGRFASWFLLSHGLSTTGVANHSIMMSYAFLMAAKSH